MSRRTVTIILAAAAALFLVGAILQLTTDGAAHVAGQVAAMVASVGLIVGLIGQSFREARRK